MAQSGSAFRSRCSPTGPPSAPPVRCTTAHDCLACLASSGRQLGAWRHIGDSLQWPARLHHARRTCPSWSASPLC
eukprot:5902883-Pyramimonas_sp.AAC.1